jgi:hypothetical protein
MHTVLNKVSMSPFTLFMAQEIKLGTAAVQFVLD